MESVGLFNYVGELCTNEEEVGEAEAGALEGRDCAEAGRGEAEGGGGEAKGDRGSKQAKG